MRYYLILLFCLVNICQAQLTVKQLKEMHDNTAKAESSMSQLQRTIADNDRRMDSIRMESFKKDNERNLDAFMASQSEHAASQKKRAYWRIGIGIALLVVLVIGLMRKKKPRDITHS